MADSPSVKARDLPGWLLTAASIGIAGHFFAVAVLVLAAPSGPWPVPYGTDMSPGPQFANYLNGFTTEFYLRHLGMTHNYHFASNRVARPDIEFEVRLKDDSGTVVKTLRFPDPDAGFQVRHRQSVLAQGLGNDQPAQPREGETVATGGEDVEKVYFWLQRSEIEQLIRKNIVPADVLRPEDGGAAEEFLGSAGAEGAVTNKVRFQLVGVPEDQRNAIPNSRQMIGRPAPWALLLAQSYMRHLCREHGAASAELVRHSQDAIMPPLMLMDRPPPEGFTEVIANFGDLKRDLEGGVQ